MKKDDRTGKAEVPGAGDVSRHQKKAAMPHAAVLLKKRRKALKSSININDRFGYRYR
ncbi:MAG: hypothetical protein AABZ39_05235 [Spirochaetota bacterium]